MRKTNDENTPLHWAAHDNAAEVAKLPIDNGAAVNAKTARDTTSLHFAGVDNAAEVAKLLIQFGAAVNAKNENGMDAFALCSVERQWEDCEPAD